MKTSTEAALALAASAAQPYSALPLSARAHLLVSIADRLDGAADQLVATAMAETGLAEARLRGELRRTTWQLRLFAEVIVEGAFLDVRIDEPDPDFVLGPRPDLRRMNFPLGPVLVFAASNFPFAFSVAGGDTAAALAAGCPVIVKAHPGHPRLSTETAAVIEAAVASANLPNGVFGLVEGVEEGVAALLDSRIAAASFTGSTTAGQKLAELAATRQPPIPFFGELGSVNPAVVTPAAFEERGQEVLTGFVGSVAGSAGQLCTKPGFLFVPASAEVSQVVQQSAEPVPEHRLLTTSIGTGFLDRVKAAQAVSEPVFDGAVRESADGYVWAKPIIVETTCEELAAAGPELLDEVFGPFSVVVKYREFDELPALLERLFPGNLTATLQLSDSDEDQVAPLLEAMRRTSGRVLINGWPTGVSVTPAMQHGGPSPATTQDSTSVGTAAISRFLRAVAFQNYPVGLLPEPLQDSNPWHIPQRRSQAGLSTSWGNLDGRY